MSCLESWGQAPHHITGSPGSRLEPGLLLWSIRRYRGVGFGRRSFFRTPTSHETDPLARYNLLTSSGRQLATGMRRLTPIVLASIAVLMGCATAQEDKARLDAADNERCISYGTTPGTPAYTDCRLKVEHLRAKLASQPLPPPKFESCPTAASGLACVNPTHGR